MLIRRSGRDRSRFAALISVAPLLVTSIALLTAGESAVADVNPFRVAFPYSFANGTCQGRMVDPVGAVFNGDAASADNAEDSVVAHAWGYRDIVSEPQAAYVYDHDTTYHCRSNGHGNTSGQPPWDTRFHMRLWSTHRGSSGGQTKTIGTPHVDKQVDCGHAVPQGGFNVARRVLNLEFKHAESHHKTNPTYWGNTRNFKQCTGTYRGSNGTVVYIGLGHQH